MKSSFDLLLNELYTRNDGVRLAKSAMINDRINQCLKKRSDLELEATEEEIRSSLRLVEHSQFSAKCRRDIALYYRTGKELEAIKAQIVYASEYEASANNL